jgi:hypothetical protein
VFFVMASLSSVIKRDLSGMGKFLMVGAIAILIGGIINVFVQSTAAMLVISVMAIGIFSAFMLYDLKRIVDGGETNYISATLALYLDILNVFQSLLACWESPAATTEPPAPTGKSRSPSGLFSWRRGASTLLFAIEHRDAFHVRRVREHVDHAGMGAAVAALVHQQARRRARASPGCSSHRRCAAAPASRRATPAAGAGPPQPWPARTRLRAADRPATSARRRRAPASPASSRTGCGRRTASAPACGPATSRASFSS